jgi:hypothetical protein
LSCTDCHPAGTFAQNSCSGAGCHDGRGVGVGDSD